MRIVKPTSGAHAQDTAFRQLVAEMLCLEHGSRVVGDDLQRLPPPHIPYPVINMAPVTARGVPYTVHYKATVGLVFYTMGHQIPELVASVAAELDQFGDMHLRTYRAAAATPSTVMRHKGRVISGNLIVGPRRPYKNAAGKDTVIPARLIQWTPPEETVDLPSHCSFRAAFTWVFMPVTAALDMGVEKMSDINANIASILYDGSGVCNVPSGRDVSPLTLSNFNAGGPLPPGLSSKHAVLNGEVILVEPTGRLVFVANVENLHAAEGRGIWPTATEVLRLPVEKWAPETILLNSREFADEKSRDFQCINCMAPLSGATVVIRAPLTPSSKLHCDWYRLAKKNTPLLPEECANGGLLLCAFCWNALESPDCLTVHMGAQVTHTVVPFSQVETAAAIPSYKRLEILLSGMASPLAGVPGAFLVKLGAAAEHATTEFVLACEKLGPYPEITNAAIAATRLGVVRGVAIAEVI